MKAPIGFLPLGQQGLARAGGIHNHHIGSALELSSQHFTIPSSDPYGMHATALEIANEHPHPLANGLIADEVARAQRSPRKETLAARRRTHIYHQGRLLGQGEQGNRRKHRGGIQAIISTGCMERVLTRWTTGNKAAHPGGLPRQRR